MLLDRNKAALVVVDVQSRLLGGIQRSEELVSNCSWLVRLAQLMAVPVIASEQYPDGLGHTEDSLRALIGEERIHGKTRFSAMDDDGFVAHFNSLEREQVVVCGMESQACLVQTALRLKECGKQVFVVADAISARNDFDTDITLRRLEQAGVVLVSREMVGFEWVRDSSTPEFRTFSKEFLR